MSALAGFCAVPAGGAGTVVAAVAVAAGELAGVCAAAGVSPAAARAIAHPINFIFTPVGTRWDGNARCRAPDLAASIGVAFRTLKQEFRRGVEGGLRAA